MSSRPRRRLHRLPLIALTWERFQVIQSEFDPSFFLFMVDRARSPSSATRSFLSSSCYKIKFSYLFLFLWAFACVASNCSLVPWDCPSASYCAALFISTGLLANFIGNGAPRRKRLSRCSCTQLVAALPPRPLQGYLPSAIPPCRSGMVPALQRGCAMAAAFQRSARSRARRGATLPGGVDSRIDYETGVAAWRFLAGSWLLRAGKLAR